MEKRHRGFSLPEAFFEGNQFGGREDCLSTRRSNGDGLEWRQLTHGAGICHAEFRSAEKNAEGTALKTRVERRHLRIPDHEDHGVGHVASQSGSL